MPDDVRHQEIIPAPRPAPPPLRSGATISAIVPTTIEEAYRLAVAVVKAGLAPDSYDMDGQKGVADPQKIMIGIMKACEVGLPPITGLGTIAIINKRPCIWGDGAVALVQSKGLIEKMEFAWEGGAEKASGPTETPTGDVDHTPTLTDFPDTLTAVCRIWRVGQATPYEGRFSVRDAKRAHLWGNHKRQPWLLYPKRMLMNRARALPLRDGFADALSGLAIREEVEDIPPPAAAKADTSFLDDAPALTHQPAEPVSVAAPPATESAAPADLHPPVSEQPPPEAGAADPSHAADKPDIFWTGTLEVKPQERGKSGDFYWGGWEQALKKRIGEAGTHMQLADLQIANKGWIERHRKARPDDAKDITEAFRARAQQIDEAA